MKRKALVVLISISLLLSVFLIAIEGETREEVFCNSEKEVVLVYSKGEDDISRKESYEGDILERYSSKVLMEISEEDKLELERKGYYVENLENRDHVGLKSYSFNVEEGLPDLPDDLEIENHPEDETGFYIVQFIGPIRREWQEELEKEGAVLHEFRHRFNFIVEMDSETKRCIEQNDFVNWVGIYQPAYRFDKEILDISGEQVIDVSFFDGIDLKGSAKEIESFGGEVLTKGRGRVTAEIHTLRIEKVANLRGVNSITERTENYELYNSDATWITQTNIEDDRKVSDQGITGEGERITVMDSELYGGNSFYDDHEMWEDPDGNPVGDNHRKIQAHYVPGDAIGDLNEGEYHGTHVTGAVLGNSPDYDSYEYYDGNALGARLVFQDIDDGSDEYIYPPSNMYEDGYGYPYNEWGANIHTNSWGSDSGYEEHAITADEFIWNHKDYNILYAIGNDGPDSNTLSEQAEGKNVLSIGSINNYPNQDEISDFSSRGYADDGRIKPTVLHVGKDLISAGRGYDEYYYMDGTSMATPGIAGQVGQIRQYYEEGWFPSGTPAKEDSFNPSNALVRATLINGAVEITGDGAYENDNKYPNNDQGFGRSKLDRVLHFEGDERDLIAYDSWTEDLELDTGESWTKEFNVDDPTQELEVTLAWTDHPGSAGSNEFDPAIVNDLDLVLNTPDGNRYVGNAFTDHNPGYSEPDPTDNPWNGLRDGEFDGLNVEENILLLPDENGVETGTYELTVTAHQVPEGKQPFAVVISGSLDEETDTEWYHHYQAPHRSEADNGLGLEEEGVWQGAIRLELPPGEITDIAYYNWDQPESVKGEIYTDGGDEPDEIIGETEEYSPTSSEEWKEISLIDPVTIDTDYYWIVLEMYDPGDNYFPFGMMENYVEDGGWISLDGETWETLHEIGYDNSWALEVRLIDAPVFVAEDWSIAPDTVNAGEQISIEGNVENVGGESGVGTVELYIDNNFINSEILDDLDPDDNETVTFYHSEEKTGTYDVRVETNADEWTSDFEIEPGDPDFVEMTPQYDLTLTAGDEERFSAEAYDQYDNLITDVDTDFKWENTDETGLFDETEAGEYEVQAAYEGVHSEPTTVTVEPAEVDYVIIDPTEDSITKAGESVSFSAEAYDEYDNLITDDDTDFTWMNADETGFFDETDAGEYEVQAAYEGVHSDPTTVTVEPSEVDYVIIDPSEDQTIDSGETIDFSAEAYDEYDNLITDDDTDFTWENADSNGTFDETDAGDYEVKATYDGESSESLTVTVETFWSNYWWMIVLIGITTFIMIGVLIVWSLKKTSYQ